MVFFSRILLFISLVLISTQALADGQVEPPSLDELLGSNSPNAQKVTISSSGKKTEEAKEAAKTNKKIKELESVKSKPVKPQAKNPDGTTGEQPGVEWQKDDLFGTDSYIKTSSNPDDDGWWLDKKGKLEVTLWKKIESNCKQCFTMVFHYNEAMRELFGLKYRLKRIQLDKQLVLDKLKKSVQKAGDAGTISGAGEGRGFYMQIIDVYEKRIENYRARIALRRARADELAHQIKECEKQCKPEDRETRIKLGEGGIPLAPPTESPIKMPVEWNGPYTTCWMCEKIAKEVNSYGSRIREILYNIKMLELEMANAQADYELARAVRGPKAAIETVEEKRELIQEDIDYENEYLKEHIGNYKKLLSALKDCEADYCKTKKVSQCPTPPANQAIAIGPNGEIGSGARLKDKAKELMGGGGGLGGLFGGKAGGGFAMGGGGRGGGMGMSSNRSLRQTNRDANSGPKQEDDPIDEDDKIEAEAGGTEILVGGQFTDDGLLISTDIEDSPGEGTFQTAFIQSFTGQRMEPNRYIIYDLWIDWKLTVTWVYKRYVDGELVEEKHGGWEERWREELGTFAKLVEGGKEIIEGIWYILGFDQATHGVKSLGTQFPITKDELKEGPVNFVVHTTLPEEDPVMTQPFIFEVSLNDDGEVVIKQVQNTLVANDC